MDKKLISMSDAAKMTPYAQDYLSLLCRRRQMQGRKIGRKWYTTVAWINKYLAGMKPESLIDEDSMKHKILPNPPFQRRETERETPSARGGQTFQKGEIKRGKRIFENGLILKPLVFWLFSVAGLVILIVGIYSILSKKVEKIQAGSTQFVPEQITKVPNEEGGFDIYGEGKMKIGQEKSVNQDNLYLNP